MISLPKILCNHNHNHFSRNPNLNVTKNKLKKFFLFPKSQTHFIFNSKFYNQIDRVAMGFYESKWQNEYNLNKPKFHLRYVDNILAAFNKEKNSLNF